MIPWGLCPDNRVVAKMEPREGVISRSSWSRFRSRFDHDFGPDSGSFSVSHSSSRSSSNSRRRRAFLSLDRCPSHVVSFGSARAGSLKVRGSIPLSSIPRPRREAQRRAAVPGPRLRDGFDSSPSLIRPRRVAQRRRSVPRRGCEKVLLVPVSDSPPYPSTPIP
jgi:hypothetical protein